MALDRTIPTRSSPRTPTRSGWSPRTGWPSTWASPGSSSSSPTRTCCSTTPGTSRARSRSTGTPSSTTRSRATTSTARGSPLCGERGHLPRHHGRLLRRPQQLVGHLRAVGVQPLRPPGRADPGRRTRQVGGRGPGDDHRGARSRSRSTTRSSSATTRRSARSRTTCSRTSGRAAGRRPLARRVLRRAAAHARLPAGGRAARRPHPRRGERAVGAGGGRGRHVQDRGPSWRRSTSRSRACPRPTTWSPTAASASAPATPGSC